jgi:hypothetical protein
MYIAGNDGTDLALAAEIRVEVDGTPGSNDMPGRILLRTTPDGSQAPVDAVKIDSAQNVTVSAGNLVIGTSGKGIDFSATPGTGTSELLSDYEEGVFTPVLQAQGGNPTVTYSTQSGWYTKVGRLVTFRLQLFTSSYTGGSGTIFIAGLPFALSSSYGNIFSLSSNRIDYGATCVMASAGADAGESKMYLLETNDNANATTTNLSSWNDSASAGVTITGSYIV